jgi:YjjG family noncanonical pyrimidine nucleotidase
MPLQNTSWILIDLDNTLLDFDKSARHCLRRAFEDYHIEDIEAATTVYKTINKKCWRAFEKGYIDVQTLKAWRFQLFVHALNLPVSAGQLNKHYLTLLSQQIDEIPGALPFIEKAKTAYQMVLVTNGFKEVQQPRIHTSGLYRYFHHVVISEVIGHAKPETAFFDHVFQLIGHPPREEVLIIGDNLFSDIQGGNNYGIKTCWYNYHMTPNPTAIAPDFEIKTFEELSTLIA